MGVPAFVPELDCQTLRCVGTASLPAASVGNTQLTGSGASAMECEKLEQQRTHVYAQDRNNFNVADWKIVEIVNGAAGTIETLKAKLPLKCTGADSVTVTWYLNGASIGTCQFTTSDADNTVKTVAPSSTAIVAGDDISVKITISGTNVGKGISAYARTHQYGS